MRRICHQCDTIHVHLHPSTYSVFQNSESINGYRLNEVYQKVEKRAKKQACLLVFIFCASLKIKINILPENCF